MSLTIIEAELSAEKVKEYPALFDKTGKGYKKKILYRILLILSLCILVYYKKNKNNNTFFSKYSFVSFMLQ